MDERGGWLAAHAFRGLERTGLAVYLVAAAYHLVRIVRLTAAAMASRA